MTTEAFEIIAELEATPGELFEAWTSPDLHSEFTGGEATGEPVEGGAFTAWDGYITGRHLVLEPGRRIVQAWRTDEFPEGAADSRVEILFEALAHGTRLTLCHSDIPAGQGARYRQGWDDYYLEPLREWLAAG